MGKTEDDGARGRGDGGMEGGADWRELSEARISRLLDALREDDAREVGELGNEHDDEGGGSAAPNALDREQEELRAQTIERLASSDALWASHGPVLHAFDRLAYAQGCAIVRDRREREWCRRKRAEEAALAQAAASARRAIAKAADRDEAELGPATLEANELWNEPGASPRPEGGESTTWAEHAARLRARAIAEMRAIPLRVEMIMEARRRNGRRHG